MELVTLMDFRLLNLAKFSVSKHWIRLSEIWMLNTLLAVESWIYSRYLNNIYGGGGGFAMLEVGGTYLVEWRLVQWRTSPIWRSSQ